MPSVFLFLLALSVFLLGAQAGGRLGQNTENRFLLVLPVLLGATTSPPQHLNADPLLVSDG